MRLQPGIRRQAVADMLAHRLDHILAVLKPTGQHHGAPVIEKHVQAKNRLVAVVVTLAAQQTFDVFPRDEAT